MISLTDRLKDSHSERETAFNGRQAMMWTAIPGIIQSFNAVALTCEVQPSIQGKQVLEDGEVIAVNLPLLLDCPVVFPHAGGCSLTFPIQPGDECIVVFSCRAIDLWWQSGGIQPPAETRMHDLSDGFVIPGPWSQVRRIPSVSTSRVELRSDDHQAVISVHPSSHEVTVETSGNLTGSVSGTVTVTAGGAVSVKCPSLTIDCPTMTFKGNVTVEGKVRASGDVTGSGISLSGHTHRGDSGGTTSAPQ